MVMTKKALLINEDGDWQFPIRSKLDATSRESACNSLKKYFGKYCGTAVSDVLLCIFCQSSAFPSETITWLGGKYEWKEENGIPVDYTVPTKGFENNTLEPIYKVYAEFGLDPINIFLETMREGGIRPWLSLRMNDCHFNTTVPNWIHPEFYYEAKKKGFMIGSNGEDYGYFNNCLDYAHSEVRDLMLNYIREVLERYDTDGIELDFQREIFCFDYRNNRECHVIMTDFIREVRRITTDAAVKRGHDILLMARVNRSVEDSLAFGFDVKTWADEGLIDAIVPCPRWDHSDSGIPAEAWKKLVGDRIAVYPGVETNQKNCSDTTYENVKAYAAGWFSSGADGLYAFNMFDSDKARNRQVWELTEEKCLFGRRDFLVAGQDVSSGFYPAFMPLPMELSRDRELTLTVGHISEGDILTLTVDFVGGERPRVILACLEPNISEYCESAVDYLRSAPASDNTVTKHREIEYKFSGVTCEKNLTLKFFGDGTVHSINLSIEAR